MAHGRPAKRRRLTPPPDDNPVSETVKSSDLFHRAADWDLEQGYEQHARQRKRKESTRLPIKTEAGRVEELPQVPVSDDEETDSFLGSASEDEAITRSDTPPTEDLDEAPPIPLRAQLLSVKEELARLASLINEDPEEHAGTFKKIAAFGEPQFHTDIRKLAFATQVAVYKDVIPGYRIRLYKDEELGIKVSKEVRRTRQYEQALVSGYHGFVKQLVATGRSQDDNRAEAGLRTVAISCACALLLAVPHFNFRTELLNVVVYQVSGRRYTPEFSKCIETLESFFTNDDDESPSFEAVSLISKMLKAKDYKVREEVLNTFHHLRLLSELSPDSVQDPSRKRQDLAKLHGRRVKKEKWEHRSKKEKKVARERKVVEKDMREADATVNHEEREKLQSETLKLVFATYFRILKARVPQLMGAALEGLAKYAHLINQDLFGDLLEALRDIVRQADSSNDPELDNDEEQHPDPKEEEQRNMTREALLATQTAFTLLSGQDASKSAASLHLDLSFFSSHAYQNLYPLALDPDIELGPQSLHLPDPHVPSSLRSNNKVNISTPILLLTRVLTSILLVPSHPPSTKTTASFYKRLLTSTPQLPEKSALAVLSLMTKLVQKHGRRLEPLWHSDERKGDGVFHGDSLTIEGTNVFAVGGGVWETELLRCHYCPQVRDEVRAMDQIVAELSRG